MNELIKESKILSMKKNSSGQVYLLEVSDELLAVIALDKNGEPLCSRSFFHSMITKRDVLKQSRSYFKQVRSCLTESNLANLKTLDFD